jgi:hypothetical protein
MTDPQIDFAETMAKWQAEREAANKAARGELLPQLRGLGVTEVIAEYEGYGDSGNIEDVMVQPARIDLPDDLCREVGDFAWSVAYHQHPGFENNEPTGTTLSGCSNWSASSAG